MRPLTNLTIGTVSAVAMMAVAGTAQADKKSGTLNIATQQEFEGVRPTFGTPGAPALYQSVVFDNLLRFDAAGGKFVPSLAVSWKRINTTTWEFKLRKGIRF